MGPLFQANPWHLSARTRTLCGVLVCHGVPYCVVRCVRLAAVLLCAVLCSGLLQCAMLRCDVVWCAKGAVTKWQWPGCFAYG